jgi:hypothetical protein
VGNGWKLVAKEQTIVHSHVLLGGKHVPYILRQSFLDSKTGRNSLNTTSTAQRAEKVCQKDGPVLTGYQLRLQR